MAIEDTIRQAIGKGVSAVTDTVNNVAGSAKGKMDEISRNVRRGELYKALGEKVFELVQQGMELPKECNDLLRELQQLAEADKQEPVKTWGIQPSEPVPVLEVKKKVPQPAPSLQMPVQRAEPAPAPVQNPYDIKTRTMPTLKVDEVYTSAEDQQ